MKRIAYLAAAGALVATSGLGAWAAADAASPAAHVRTVDRHGADDPAGHRHHNEPGDDHGRHNEPGDDHGRHNEPGDDHGGHRHGNDG